MRRPTKLWLVLLSLSACSAKVEKKTSLTPKTRAGEVVATVNGEPIFAADLVLQMRDGQTKKEALHARIQFELLAQESVRRGLHNTREVRDIAQRSAAQLLIRRAFGEVFRKENVAETYIAQAYKLNKARFVHPEKYETVHLVAKASRKQSPARHKMARDAIVQARQIALGGKLSAKEFSEIPSLIPHKGLRFISQSHIASEFSVVPNYAKAMLKLQKPGDVSEIVKTRHGYHLIYLKGRIPARNASVADAHDEIRDKIYDDVRRVEFEKFASELEKKAQAAINPAALSAAPQ